MAEVLCAKSRLFDVCDFSRDAFFHALSNPFCDPVTVAGSAVPEYLAGYLDAIQAKSIIVEYDYTDGDYLDDYASYYVKCFAPYPRRCRRLHFFSRPIDTELVRRLVAARAKASEEKAFRNAYLGFVVARPLPEAVVGRTVLATYDTAGGRRQFSAIRDYRANLFGVELQVRSLAFQEQDTVLAACATVALWSALHKDASLFGTPTPTPASITRAANRYWHDSRPLPSQNLDLGQICSAIESFGLEPEVIEIKPSTPLLSVIHSYLSFGLPIVLGGFCRDGVGHAVTINGFSLRDQPQMLSEVAQTQRSVNTTARCIDEVYVHDDQLGPFAAMKVRKLRRATVPRAVRDQFLDLPPVAFYARDTGEPLYPHVVVIPVYPKIRLRHLDFQAWLTKLTAFFDERLEWDIKLLYSNNYKSWLRKPKSGPLEIRSAVLLQQHPRFIWRGVMRYRGVPLLEILGDATEIQRAFPLYLAIWHDLDFAEQVEELINSNKSNANGFLTPRLVDLLTTSLRQQRASSRSSLTVPCEVADGTHCLFARAPSSTFGSSIERTCLPFSGATVSLEKHAQHN